VARPLFHGMALEVELVGQVLEQLEFWVCYAALWTDLA